MNDFYDEAYSILVEKGGAREWLRAAFIHYYTKGNGTEWRFQGKFGYGGKFWYRPYLGHDVNYYREDGTKELDALMAEINNDLRQLESKHKLTYGD